MSVGPLLYPRDFSRGFWAAIEQELSFHDVRINVPLLFVDIRICTSLSVSKVKSGSFNHIITHVDFTILQIHQGITDWESCLSYAI